MQLARKRSAWVHWRGRAGSSVSATLRCTLAYGHHFQVPGGGSLKPGEAFEIIRLS